MVAANSRWFSNAIPQPNYYQYYITNIGISAAS